MKHQPSETTGSRSDTTAAGAREKTPGPPKFIVDLNVGRLAKRLRMMGYDAVFINGLDDDELVRIALREGRILLTKDQGIMRRRIVSSGKVRALLITDGDVRRQLRQVIRTFDLKPGARPFTRCMECNEPLQDRTKAQVENLVPPYVYAAHDQFMQCPRCGRVYWRGTHWERMNHEIRRMESNQ